MFPKSHSPCGDVRQLKKRTKSIPNESGPGDRLILSGSVYQRLSDSNGTSHLPLYRYGVGPHRDPLQTTNRSVRVSRYPFSPIPAVPLCVAPTQPAHGLISIRNRCKNMSVHLTDSSTIRARRSTELSRLRFLFRDMLCMKRIYFVLGHALHETGLQRQKSIGTPVSSQEKRALAAPLINR